MIEEIIVKGVSQGHSNADIVTGKLMIVKLLSHNPVSCVAEYDISISKV